MDTSLLQAKRAAKWKRPGHTASNQYPLDFIERDLVIAAVVEACGPGALVVGHLLRDFELAAVAQVIRDVRDGMKTSCRC